MAKNKEQKEADLLAQGREEFGRAMERDQDNRQLAADDLRFAFSDGDQWEEEIRNERGPRPCYQFNRIEPVIDQIVGEQRKASPQIKLRPVEQVDSKTTDTLAGMIRNIEAISDAKSIYDQQFVYAVAAGVGNWRVLNEYSTDKGFDQDIYIRDIPNPFSVVWGKANHPTKRDADDCFVYEKIPLEAFKAKHPDATTVSMDAIDVEDDWYDGNDVRVAEWYHRYKKNRTLVELSDGNTHWKDEIASVLDELEAQGITVEKSREVETTKIRWVKMNGAEILEEPIEYDWKWIPVVHLAGKQYNIEGRPVWKGIVRNSKDAQRVYNYTRTSITEFVLTRPKAAWLVTKKMVKGMRQFWDTAHKKIYPYLPYNHDSDVPAGPIKQQADPVPVDQITLAQGAVDDIKATTGYHDPSLGNAAAAESGIAINARKVEGDVGSYIYVDHYAKAIQQTGEILLDMIPTVYDTKREIRVLNDEGTEDFIELNGEGPDVTQRRKIDVMVTVGPSYTTARQEASDKLIQMGAAWPVMYDLAPDIIVEGLDVPKSTELVSRLRKRLIDQGTVEPTEAEQEKGWGQQPPPDPMVVSMLQKLDADTQQQQVETDGMQIDNIGKQLENVNKALEDDHTRAKIVKLLSDAGKSAPQVPQA